VDAKTIHVNLYVELYMVAKTPQLQITINGQMGMTDHVWDVREREAAIHLFLVVVAQIQTLAIIVKKLNTTMVHVQDALKVLTAPEQIVHVVLSMMDKTVAIGNLALQDPVCRMDVQTPPPAIGTRQPLVTIIHVYAAIMVRISLV
jgi:hypothetical protein